MLKHLFPPKGRFYKANMHMHSTVSDGLCTPEEIKETYKAHGYSILAYTDHNVMVDHSDLNDEDFLAITSHEVDISDFSTGRPFDFRRVYHINLYAKKPHETYYPLANPSYACGNAKNFVQDYYVGDTERVYSIEFVNRLITDAHEHGFLVSFCHPFWSLQNYNDYAAMSEVDFMELYNSGNFVNGYELDASDAIWHDMLRLGKRPLPLCVDDAHRPDQFFGGWIWVKAEALEYGAVMSALEKGDMYASWGPEIKDLTFDTETRKLKVETSEVVKIFVMSERRFAAKVWAKPGQTIEGAEFDLGEFIDRTLEYASPDESFVRVILIDREGNKAFSRAYTVKELC